MNKVLQAFVASAFFRKFSNTFGTVALTLLFMGRYHTQVRATLDLWGVSQNAWTAALLFIVGASSLGSSIVATVLNEKQRNATDKANAHQDSETQRQTILNTPLP